MDWITFDSFPQQKRGPKENTVVHFNYLTRSRGNGITRNMRKILKVSHGRRGSAVHQTRLAMKFMVTIQRDEQGMWIVECPSIPGCVSQGATKEEALKNIEEAIALCLEVRAERGLPLTIETRQLEVVA